jgi:hypothetical protein
VTITTGLVQRVFWENSFVCAQIGTTAASAELLFLRFRSSDSRELRDLKRAAATALAEAAATGRVVKAAHPDDSAELVSVSLARYDVSPNGPARHGDFFAVSGSGIPANVEIVFDSAIVTVTVTPDVVRPQFALISQLPSVIPTGRNQLRLQAPGWASGSLPIQVSARPRLRVRPLYSGAPKTEPYTIVFVANPAIEAETGGTVTADPVLADRVGYHEAVAACLFILLRVTEDVLRQREWDSEIRLVSVFDETRPAVTETALAHEVSPNIMEAQRFRLNAFLASYRLRADIVFVIHGSTTHGRASAWWTSDDENRPSTSYTYDGVNRVHGHYARIPGSIAIPSSFDKTKPTPLHEFGHASSDLVNGRVLDLYDDDRSPGFFDFDVNKKARGSAIDPIPVDFASYNGTNYQSDQTRNAIGYPADWTSYHPVLLDSTRPNLMDDYRQTADPQRCRLDRLTYAWLSDRLQAKIFR